MNCIICNAAMRYSFTQDFEGAYALDKVDYWVCPDCGFVASKTHFEMGVKTWERLNADYHKDLFDLNSELASYHKGRCKRHFAQAHLLYLLAQHKLIDTAGQWLDWGSGEGGMSQQLAKHYGLKIENFDAYRSGGAVPQKRGYALVMCSAVFEHVRSRKELDEIESCVAPNGCLGLHTGIHQAVPDHPWHYALPPHCAFHTWRSMRLLLEAWGYVCGVFYRPSLTLVFFRHDVGESVRRLNQLIGRPLMEFCERPKWRGV